ncbi:hypothetical protein P0L94_10745 [Microbacter sp. GSS18]|nr:hypothetical protein P0L94_10745 [Microbacter sp. GSS18]
MTDGSGGGAGGSVPPVQALAFASVAFVALLIAGLGLTSLALDADVIAEPGLGPVPGVAATATGTAAFALVLWLGVRGPARTYRTSLWCAAAAYAGYVAGVWLGALLAGAGPGAAFGAAGGVAVSWFGLVVAGVGLVCGWGGVALARTRAERPRWPWEDDEEDG